MDQEEALEKMIRDYDKAVEQVKILHEMVLPLCTTPTNLEGELSLFDWLLETYQDGDVYTNDMVASAAREWDMRDPRDLE